MMRKHSPESIIQICLNNGFYYKSAKPCKTRKVRFCGVLVKIGKKKLTGFGVCGKVKQFFFWQVSIRTPRRADNADGAKTENRAS